MAHDYDIILVGRGLGGAALGKVLVEQGVYVLVLVSLGRAEIQYTA